jgi:sugar-specific transcriptional regulator TrmB
LQKKGLKLAKKGEEVSEILTSSTRSLQTPTKIDLLIGMDNIYRKSIKFVNKTKKEINLISTGENIPNNLMLAMKKAVNRGVKIKMIAHKFNKENIDVLSSKSNRNTL